VLLMAMAWLVGCSGSLGVPNLLAPPGQLTREASPEAQALAPSPTPSPAAPSPTASLVPTATPPRYPTPTVTPPVTQTTYWPTTGWRTSTPEEQGIDSAALANIVADIQQHMHIHSLLVVRHGYLVSQAYFYPNGPDIKHQEFSVTKGVTSAAVGIAVGQGKLRLDQPVLATLGRTAANMDPRKAAITVENLLDMTAGFAWDESSVPYGNPKNMETQMSQSPDWVQFVLDRPMADQPGTKFVYNSGAAHLLSALVQKATGQTLLQFATANLFHPLGITDVKWPSDPQGITEGHVDLWLTPRDMAKLGYLYLKDGVWDGTQLLPPGWVAASTKKQSGGDPGFGYQWRRTNFNAFEAVGWGSQLIGVLPAQDLVVVVTGGVAPGEPGSEESIFRRISQETVKASGPLPPNPDGMANLDTQVRAAAESSPRPVPPLGPTAQRISGQTYALAANADQLKSLRLTFGRGATAEMDLLVGNEDQQLSLGLDNVYRVTPIANERYALRGYWLDDETLIIESQILGAADSTTYQLTFTGDRVDGQAVAHIEDYMAAIHGLAEPGPLVSSQCGATAAPGACPK